MTPTEAALPPLRGIAIWSWRDPAGGYWSVVLDYRTDAAGGRPDRVLGYEVACRSEERLGNGRIRCTVTAAVGCRSRAWAEHEAGRLREEGGYGAD